MPLSLQRIDCSKLPLKSAPHDSAVAEALVPAELEQLDVATYASWGGGLSLADYMRRERVLRATAFSRRGLSTWVLRDGDTGLASCESYELDVRGGQKCGTGYGIASVFVEPHLRGHGYASELLSRVHAALRQDGGLLCYLMSEIGPTLYQRLGYVGRPLFVRRYAAVDKAPPPCELLTADAIAEALAACQRPLGTLSVKVSVEHVLWHLARSRYYAEALKRPLPVCVGARAAGGTAMALWAPEYRLSVLQVLTLYLQPGADRAAMDGVLTAGRRLAAELGLSTLEIWENPHNAGFLAGGERISSTKDLPMLLGLEPGVRGEDWLDYERAHWL